MSKILIIDINCIPQGWKPKDFLRHIKDSGIAWIDTDKPGIKVSNPPIYQIDSDGLGGIEFLKDNEFENIEFKKVNE